MFLESAVPDAGSVAIPPSREATGVTTVDITPALEGSEEGQTMLFQSRTAQVSVFQGEDEVQGTRTTHGYDFDIPVQPGEVTVRFTNTTTDPVSASLDGGEQNVPVAPGGSHDFNLTVTEAVDVRLSWGTRNAMLTFTV